MWMWIIAGIVLDQLVKLWVVSTLTLGAFWHVFPGVYLTFALNKGVAFSLFSSAKTVYAVMLHTMIFAFNWMLIEWLYTLRAEPLSQRIGLMLILSGGLSNLFDRVCYGAVVDYMTLAYAGFVWPTIFNLADVWICIGCALLLRYHASTAVRAEHASGI